ncbi:serine protein kinase RIO [Nanoarchaeota archaeon]
MTTLTYQERFKTLKGVFDEFTNRNLFDLSKKYFDELVSPIFVGKESNVFLAKKGSKKVIVKIYRIQNCNFNQMYSYIRKDSRYEFLKRKKREIIFAWTQREYKNLLTAEKAKLNSPKPIAIKHNVLVEEMIGDKEPALRLKDHHPDDPKEFLKQIIQQMKKLYGAGLVHGDLSAFNILNYNEKPYLIDFSQSTLTRSNNAEELLKRDVKNVLQFFKKLDITADFERTFKKIVEK